MRYDLTAAAYSVTPKDAPALVIGAGGGRDVYSALLFGSPSVRAVEINPIIVDDIMRGAFAERSGNLYRDPRVQVTVADARSFIQNSKEEFGAIQLSLVDTWAATAAGAFNLSENNLYTVEAVTSYIEHLTPTGVLTMIRYSGTEGLKLLGLLYRSAKASGIADPKQHIVVLGAKHAFVGGVRLVNVLFRKTPFDENAIRRLEEHVDNVGLDWVVHPFIQKPTMEAKVAESTEPELVASQLSHRLVVTPNDDRPFFFFSPDKQFLINFVRAIYHNPLTLHSVGEYLLIEILALACLLGVLFIVVPLRRYHRISRGSEESWFFRRAMPYFVCLGIGFMFIEMALMQRLVLFLGHPTYAFTVVLSSLLIGAAGGAWSAGKWKDWILSNMAWLLLTCTGVFALILVSQWFYTTWVVQWTHLPFVAKVVIAELFILPIGCLLGTMMPVGIAVVSRVSPNLVPYAWGINGVASVIGSSSAVLCSMVFGFSATYLIGGATYLVAGATLYAIRHRIAERTAAPFTTESGLAEIVPELQGALLGSASLK